jgi:hypothetical protein
MTQTNELLKLYRELRPDRWRRDHPFSEDISVTNGVLFDTYATPAQCEIQLLNWLQRNQPCVFGRIAAVKGFLHFCIIRDADILTRTDQEIANLIKGSLREWKRRSLKPADEFSTAAHGFVLIVASQHVALAAPDKHLFTFSCKLRELWGCSSTNTDWGIVHWETLYMQDPRSERYVKFTFSVDFFAARGDGRWWQDHRSPGGVLFTANSVGHMMRYREWYQDMKDQREWCLQSAMLTIEGAAETPYGKATWLKPLQKNGKPIVEDLACPFSSPERIKKELADKDWTRYAGYLHTDLSIRDEFFFHEDPEPKADTISKEYLQDFAYLYDVRQQDNLRFVEGVPVSKEEVEDAIGPVSTFTQIGRRPDAFRKSSPLAFRDAPDPRLRSPDPEVRSHARQIQALLDEGRKWRLSKQEISRFESLV